MVYIAPSILSCDFANLGQGVKDAEKAGADFIHVDVMDGVFVPNITIGQDVVKAIRKVTDVPFDVHLMISEPIKYVSDFALAGADIITVHLEACGDIEKTIEKIHDSGAKAGISIKPGTPAEEIFPYLTDIDLVLVMTVEPGFGGQSFMEDQIPKIRKISEKTRELGLDILIEVDGGISKDTAKLVVEAGANMLVAGSALFCHPKGISFATQELRGSF